MTQATRKSKRHVIIETRYSRWFRTYVSLRHDRKILRLRDDQFRSLILLWTLAAEHPDGHLPSSDDLAIELRRSVDDVQHLVNHLIDVGLLDIVSRSGATCTVRPHNWEHRQFRSDHDAAERQRRSRKRRRWKNRQSTVSRDSHDVSRDMSRDRSDSVSDSVYVDTGLSNEDRYPDISRYTGLSEYVDTGVGSGDYEGACDGDGGDR